APPGDRRCSARRLAGRPGMRALRTHEREMPGHDLYRLLVAVAVRTLVAAVELLGDRARASQPRGDRHTQLVALADVADAKRDPNVAVAARAEGSPLRLLDELGD